MEPRRAETFDLQIVRLATASPMPHPVVRGIDMVSF
jgi:hypothetical protein